jgi:capsular polysaccharide export protein
MSDETCAPSGRIAIPRAELKRIPYLGAFLPDCDLIPFTLTPPAGIDGILVSQTGVRSRLYDRHAARKSLPLWRFSEGPISAKAFAGEGASALSMVFERFGHYADSREPSQFEALMASYTGTGGDHGYNLHVSHEAEPNTLLLIDQSNTDAGLPFGLAAPSDLIEMAEEARKRHPKARIYILPDAHASAIGGGILSRRAAYLGLEIAPTSLAALDLIERAGEVWTVSSPFGFDAAIRGVPTRLLGRPWYAGWGLSKEELPPSPDLAARRKPLSCNDVLTALGRTARFADPVLHRPLDLQGALDRLADWRQRIGPKRRHYACLGFQPWKRPFARAFLPDAIPPIRFVKSKDEVRKGETICAWGNKVDERSAVDDGTRQHLWRLEDGFIRSVGLGSDFISPVSLCLDRQGIYYDARRVSDLESILESADFSEELLSAAAELRRAIVSTRVTKYNAEEPVALPSAADGRRVVLVAGQVADDQSIEFGRPVFAGHLALLEAVRIRCADDYVIYKEHPDVVAGNRPGRLSSSDILQHADLIANDGNMADWLDAVDNVHVATSLTGFEALLRGKTVSTWGMPFYAGWGLTDDEVVCPRRTRLLSIDALVAGSLILYPRYVDPASRIPCSAQDALAVIIRGRSVTPRPVLRVPRQWRRHLAYVRRMSGEWLSATR